MDQRIVRRLEKDIQGVIVETLTRNGLKRLPLLPSQETTHLMAKAAVTVYEAVVTARDCEFNNDTPRM